MIDDVILLRHGRTTFNLHRRMQGQIDVPLDIIGQWQVDQSAYELAKTLYWAKVSSIADHPDQLVQPDPHAARRSDIEEYRQAPAARRLLRIVSSDLFRAQQTAHAFADLMRLPVELDTRLRERSFGQWEGMTREEIRRMDAEAYASWKAHTGGELAYGVESREAVGRRGAQAVASMLADAVAQPRPTTLMLVGHGSWIVATVATLLGLDPDSLNALGAVRNACWSRMTPVYDGDVVSWQLDQYNQGPAIARLTDWENGPQDLRRPDMPMWKPITVSA